MVVLFSGDALGLVLIKAGFIVNTQRSLNYITDPIAITFCEHYLIAVESNVSGETRTIGQQKAACLRR